MVPRALLVVACFALLPAFSPAAGAADSAPVDVEAEIGKSCTLLPCKLPSCPLASCAIIQATVGIHDLQQDGGTTGDASNTCFAPDPVLAVEFDRSGLLDELTGDDEDNYDARVFNTTLPRIRVTLDLYDDLSTGSIAFNGARDVDLYVYRWTGVGCGTLVASSTGAGFHKSVTFSRAGATQFTIRLVDNGYFLPIEHYCGTCPVSAIEPAERTMCYPACSTVNGFVGYRFAATQLS